MIINASMISMDAERLQNKRTVYNQVERLTQRGTGAVQVNSTSYMESNTEYSKVSFLDSYDKALQASNQEAIPSQLYGRPGAGNVGIGTAKNALRTYHAQLRRQIEEFMERLKQQMLGRFYGNDKGIYQGMSKTFGMDSSINVAVGQANDSADGIINLASSSNAMVWEREISTSISYQESEYTSFHSKGMVTTADGREITFNVSMEMSREFMASSNITANDTVILTDPLIINLNSNPTQISDQKWQFDIDGDGKLDNISQLARGSGYLALDLNDDGKINDGSELFGTKSGNGFQDLSAYDKDGNGWIDENDSVFSKLKVWVKDDSGQDVLLDLLSADIGAIYLGNVSTEFSHTGADNTLNAQVRQSGIYLKESGGVGTVQQVDFAS